MQGTRRRHLLLCAPDHLCALWRALPPTFTRKNYTRLPKRENTVKHPSICLAHRTIKRRFFLKENNLLVFALIGPIDRRLSHCESELKIYAPGICDAAWGTRVKHSDKPGLARTIRAIKRLLINKHTGCPLKRKKAASHALCLSWQGDDGVQIGLPSISARWLYTGVLLSPLIRS